MSVDKLVRVTVRLHAEGWTEQVKYFKVKETPKLYKLDEEERSWERHISKNKLGEIDTPFLNNRDYVQYRAWILDIPEDIEKIKADIIERIKSETRIKYQEVYSLYKHLEEDA